MSNNISLWIKILSIIFNTIIKYLIFSLVIATIEKFEIEQICELLKKLSNDKEAFLNLMKFSKQSPIFLEDDKDFQIAAKYGYTQRASSVHYKDRVSLI